MSVYNGQYDELQKQQDALHKEDSKLRTEKVWNQIEQGTIPRSYPNSIESTESKD